MATFIDQIDFRRIGGAKGPALAAGDFAMSGGMGSTSTAAPLAGSTDFAGRVTITSSGTGQGASPTITLTFKEPFAAAPFALAVRSGGSQLTVPVTAVATTTTLVITLNGTPVAAETYIITWAVIASA
jgi:methionine-rich copper-binding protein CopC